MSIVPGTNKHDFDYGGYKTDQDPFSLKTGDKSFSGPQIEIKSQKARVFIAGYDVTPDILDISITQEREGHNSCSISLANPRNKYVVTKEDLLLYFDNRNGIDPVRKNSDYLPTYSYAQSSVSFDGGGKEPVAPFKDFGHPNSDTMKNVYLHEVNDVYQRETPKNVSPETTFKEMLWKVKRHSGIYKFENDVIFDFKEPVIVFLQGRYSPYWYFGFTGFLTAYNKNFEYGGEPAIDITASSRKYQFALQTEVIEPALSREHSLEGKNANLRSDNSINNRLKNFMMGSLLKDAILNLFLKFVQDKRLGGLPCVPVNYWEANYVTFFEEVLGTGEDRNNYAIRNNKGQFFETGFQVLSDAVKGLWNKITSHLVDDDKGGGRFQVGDTTPEVLCAIEVDTQNFYDSINFDKVPNDPEESSTDGLFDKAAKVIESVVLPDQPPRRIRGSDPMNSNYSQLLGDSVYQVNIFTVKPYTTANVGTIYDNNTVRLWESDFEFDKNECKWRSWQSVAAVGVHPAVTEDFINKFHILPKIYGIVLEHSVLRPVDVRIADKVEEVPVQGPSIPKVIPLNLGQGAEAYPQGQSILVRSTQITIMKEFNKLGIECLKKLDSANGFKISITAHDDIARWVPRGFLDPTKKPSTDVLDVGYERRLLGKHPTKKGPAEPARINKYMLPQFNKFTALDEYDGDINSSNAYKVRSHHFYVSEENFEADKLLSFTRASGVAEFIARIVQAVDAFDDKGNVTRQAIIDKWGWNEIDTKPKASMRSVYKDGARLGMLLSKELLIKYVGDLVKLKKEKPDLWNKVKVAVGTTIDDANYSLVVSDAIGVTIDGKGWEQPSIEYKIGSRHKELQKATEKLSNFIARTTFGVLMFADGSYAGDSGNQYPGNKISRAIAKYGTEEDLKKALSTARFTKNVSKKNKEGGSRETYSSIAERDINQAIQTLAGTDNSRFGIGSYRDTLIKILASDTSEEGRENNRRFDAKIDVDGPKYKSDKIIEKVRIPQYTKKMLVCIEQADRSPYDKLKEQVFGVPTEANYKVTGFNLHRPKFILMLPPLYMSDTHPLMAQMRNFNLFENESATVESLLESLKEHMQFNYYETPLGDIIFEPYNYDTHPDQQISAYLNRDAGEITPRDEYENEGESFFGIPQGDSDDPETEKLTYLPVRPTYISMRYSPKRLKMNRLPIVAPKRYFRHPYYFSDIDEKQIGYSFDSANMFSRIVVTGNSQSGTASGFNAFAQKDFLGQARLFGRLQDTSFRTDLIDGAIPFGKYVADGFEEDVLYLEKGTQVSKWTYDLKLKADSLHRTILKGDDAKFSKAMKDLGYTSSKIGSTVEGFILNNLLPVANEEISERNRETRQSNQGKNSSQGKVASGDDKAEITALTNVSSDANFEKILLYLHKSTTYISLDITNFPTEQIPPSKAAASSRSEKYIRDFPLYSLEVPADKIQKRKDFLTAQLNSKKIVKDEVDPKKQKEEAQNNSISAGKLKEAIAEYDRKIQTILQSYCLYLVHRSKFGKDINDKIKKAEGDFNKEKEKKVNEPRIFTVADYSKKRREGTYNPQSDLVSLYGIKEAPPVHVNYLKTPLECKIYAIALFNQYYNNAYKYEYGNLAMTPEWLVNKTGYFEYENFISLLDRVTHTWSPNGTPASSVGTSYLRRNILHYKNGAVLLDEKLLGLKGGEGGGFGRDYVSEVTVTNDTQNYTQKFSAYRRLGALHESLIESIQEDGEPSAADLLFARLQLVPKLRAIMNQLADQYKRWISSAQSEIDTKYNVYISDLKATLGNIVTIKANLAALGVSIATDKKQIEFYEAQIKNLEADLKIKDNTIKSLEQENAALAVEKSNLQAEIDAKKDSKLLEDLTTVSYNTQRIATINKITAVNNTLINETIPEQQNQVRIEQAKTIDAKNLLEKQVTNKKSTLDPKVRANSQASLEADLAKEIEKRTLLQRKIEVFLKSFNDSVGKYMGVVYSSQDYSSAGISYFNAMKSKDIKDAFDVTHMVTFNANNYGNKDPESRSKGTVSVNYTEFYLPKYRASVDTKGYTLREGEYTLSFDIPNSVNPDKALVVEDLSTAMRTGFGAFVDVVLLSNFKKVPPLVVAMKALQNRIDAALNAEKDAGSI